MRGGKVKSTLGRNLSTHPGEREWQHNLLCEQKHDKAAQCQKKKMALKHPLDVSASKEKTSKIMSSFKKNTNIFKSEQGKKKNWGNDRFFSRGCHPYVFALPNRSHHIRTEQ